MATHHSPPEWSNSCVTAASRCAAYRRHRGQPFAVRSVRRPGASSVHSVMLLAMPARTSIVCRYIFMHALYLRLVNPTDFHGRPKRQEEPEIAQVDSPETEKSG